MTEKTKNPGKAPETADPREAKLNAALRANLLRRKAAQKQAQTEPRE